MTTDNLHYEKFTDGNVKCIEDEIPFELPDGWAWCRLGLICPYGECTKIKPNMICDTEWILDLEDIEKDTGRIIAFHTKRERESVSDKHKFQAGQLLYSKLRPYLNKVLIAPKDGYCTSEILPLSFWGNIEPKYIQLYLKSEIFLSYVNLISYGVKMPRLGTEDGKKALFALPPINEQKRIVEKYYQTIPLIEDLTQYQTTLETDIISIKSKILDLSIRGKLVPQDENDEPASVLLKCIRAEKEELIKAGKIKRDKKESVIFKGDDNSYYRDLPSGWELCSILNVAEVELGKTLDKAKNTGTFYPYLRSVNIKWNDIDMSSLNEMRFEPEEIERYTVQKNDLLICEGGDVGRCCVWNDEPILYQNALHRVRFYNSCNPYFFMYTLMLMESCGYLKKISNGVTIKHLTKSVLSTIQFPLPPLAEQQRIVETIEIAFTQFNNIANLIS